MIKPLLSFFIAIAVLDNAYGQYGVQGINGSADRRIVIGWDGSRPDYVLPSTQSIWNTSPYNSIVHVLPAYGSGEFISPKHIVTNAHVGQECGMDCYKNCEIHTSD